MRKIGYKEAESIGENLMVIAEQRLKQMQPHDEEKRYTVEEIMQMEADRHTIQVIKEYMNRYAYPFIKGKDRDAWLLDRLKRIRQKFILPAF